MSLSEIFLPLRRHQYLFYTLFISLCFILWGASTYLLPPTQKITIYSTVKPLLLENPEGSENTNPPAQFSMLDSAETSMKVAEAVSGWVQNPAFREQIKVESGVEIKNFKRKISARKQNRLNIFWTIKLTGDEIKNEEQIVKAFYSVLGQNWVEFNSNNSTPFALSQLQRYSEPRVIPFGYIALSLIILSLFISIFVIYFYEIIRNKTSFKIQVQNIFPKSQILTVPEHVGAHDEKLLGRYVSTFKSPRLVGTFAKAEKSFALAPSDAVDETIDTAILLVRLGDTTIRELQNLKAIFGDKVGIILFEK